MKKVVILGCGFVGVRAARLFSRAGWEVVGVTRSEESAAQLAGESFQVIACDIADEASLSAREELQEAGVLISAVSSGKGGVEKYREVYLKGLQNALGCLGPRRVLFVSSTSVYAQTDGSLVTEESPAEPASPTSRVLREAEDLALSVGGWVARLAGIYGPGRSVLLKKFLEKTAVIEDGGSRHINQIHADDAASALAHLAIFKAPSGIYNVVDDEPLTQLELYSFLARHFAEPPPPRGAADPNRKRGLTDKRVSNAKLRALKWLPWHRSFQEAVTLDAGLLQAARAGGSGDAPP
jgi:nucleoside-diphosphate-sugar epimerase